MTIPARCIFAAFLLTQILAPPASLAQSSAGADSTFAAPAPGDSTLARALVRAGLENILVTRSAGEARVAFENRRYRHTATALGIISRAARTPSMIFERRLGMVAAAFPDSGNGSVPRTALYPSDPDFPVPPVGRSAASTRHNVDLLFEPLFSYELAKIIDPAYDRLELQPNLVYNPWPGARARVSVVIPVHDDFHDRSPEFPDEFRFRPGPMTLDQFAWIPKVALVSGTIGVLGDYRYGFSAGAARPLALSGLTNGYVGGQLLLDAQADVTGFIAFRGDSGTTYSYLDRFTGRVSATYRPPRLDLGIRLSAARYLEEDTGVELEVKRTMGDFDVAFFIQRFAEGDIAGMRLVLPIPPMVRPVGWPVRVLPADRFGLDYQEISTGAGASVFNVASREEYLRQLDPAALEANAYRYRGQRGRETPRPPSVSLVGMTGFINTPWCGVMGDGEVEVGYNRYPKEASYQYRGQFPNEVYYAALGFLPRLEVGLRWTVMPGAKPFAAEVPETRYTDADRMFSGRIEILQARPGRPGFAIGGEDIRGTRRFYSTYGVFGMPFDFYRLQNRVTLGYAPHVFTASRRSLDGLFGAFEASAWRPIALALEHDSEKWNTMLGINLGFGLRARVALLDLEHLSFGAGWYRAL